MSLSDTKTAKRILQTMYAQHPGATGKLDRILAIHAATVAAGCPWGCNGHNQPKHNKG